jgi:hypothetical protein
VTYQIPDGAPVSYVGDGHDGRAIGERGQLLTTSGRVAHVKWADGAITPHDVEDVAPARASHGAARALVRDELEDSLDVGPVMHTGIRATYEVDGEAGVLNALASAGQLGGLQGIAEEVVTFTEQRIRQTGALHAVAGQLDEDEIDSVTRLAALVLLRDAFEQVDE